MRPKNYPYRDVDGNHWPDTCRGDNLYYAIDFTPWLASENDTLVDVTWELPEDLDGTDAYEDGSIAYIKLSSTKIGSYHVKCTAITEEDGKQQSKTVPMVLRVYA